MSDLSASPPAARRREPPAELIAELEGVGVAAGSYDFEPLDAMRRTIARRTTEAFRDVPHFSLTSRIEADALIAARADPLAAGDPRPSLNDMMIKAAALALIEVGAVNASYTAKGLIRHRRADIAVAVATDGGLVTPIVRGAEAKSLAAISVEMRDLVERAKIKRLQPHEYTGGGFSISNLGMFGVTSFTSILNPPQGAILSLGAAETQFVFDGAEPGSPRCCTPP